MKKRIKILSLLAAALVILVQPACNNDGIMNFSNDAQGNFDALWTIIDRNYCFFEYKNIDWDSVYQEYRPRVTNDMQHDALFNLMGMMLAELKDGHVNLFASNDMSRYWEWKQGYADNFELSIVNETYLKSNYYVEGGMKYKILPDNVGYIYYESFNDAITESEFEKILAAMNNSLGLIIDIRGNGGGSLENVDRFAKKFFTKKTLVGYISHKTGWGHNDFSGLFPQYVGGAGKNCYPHPVALLTNRSCYSAANQFASIMKYAPNTTIIGDNTGGGSGLPFTSELPNGWSLRFSASPLFNAEKEHIEFGIEPHVKISLTQNDIERNTDTLIETARSLIRQKSANKN